MVYQTSNRIPTLDGWRGAAILMVLLAHLQRSYLHSYLFGTRWLDMGQHGVTVFFVLSGYLITTGLLTNDTISLKQFYVRRFFRIMPAALTYLAFLVTLTCFTEMKVIGNDLWRCLLSCRNYLPETASNTCTEHFWSLSVEEQFYLVWPGMLVMFGRRYSAGVAALAAVSIAALRFFNWNYYAVDYRFLHTEARADALLVGCLLALALKHASIQEFFERHGKWLFLCCAAPLAWDIYHFDTLPPLHESALIALMVGSTVFNPTMAPSRLLEVEHLRTTGLMSYSIYLWQGLFFRPNWGFCGPLLLIAAVFVSYLFIEKHGIALGRYIAQKWRSPSLDPLQPAPVASTALLITGPRDF
jgi:peptidoglycan/LPS O-acetylase OafA/YrhL